MLEYVIEVVDAIARHREVGHGFRTTAGMRVVVEEDTPDFREEHFQRQCMLVERRMWSSQLYWHLPRNLDSRSPS